MPKVRKVFFKNPGDSLVFQGQRIDANNITPELVDEITAIAPSLADHFDEVEVEADKSVSDEKKVKPAKPADA